MDSSHKDRSSFYGEQNVDEYKEQNSVGNTSDLKSLAPFSIHDHETTSNDPKQLSILQSTYRDENGNEENIYFRPKRSELPSVDALQVNNTFWSEAMHREMTPYQAIKLVMDILPRSSRIFSFTPFEQQVQEEQAKLHVYPQPYISTKHPSADVRAISIIAWRAGLISLGEDGGEPSTKLGSFCAANGIEVPDHDSSNDVKATEELLYRSLGHPAIRQLVLDKTNGREPYYRQVVEAPYVLYCDTYKKDGSMQALLTMEGQWPGWVRVMDMDHPILRKPALTSEDYEEIALDNVSNFVKTKKTHGADVLMVPSDCSLSKVICKSEQDQIYRERAERHSGDEKLFDAVTRCFQTRGKKRKGGQKPNFLPYPDKPVAKAFHAAPNHEKYAIAQRFQSSHHKELALAVIWDLCPESLPSAERARIDDLVEESWRCDSLPGRTFSSAKEDIQRALAGSPSKRDLAIITDYKSVLSLLEQKGVRYYG